MNFSIRQAHPYHLVDVSPWPLLMSVAVLTGAIGLVGWLGHFSTNLVPALLVIILVALQWWRDVIREAKGGYHTTLVQRGLLIGFILFLLSEIMLFMSFFWAFFHSALAPAVELGSTWPPVGILAVDPWGIPLLGSCILLASGFVLTLGHHAFFLGNKDLVLVSMFFTVLLGALFLFLQFNEYYYSTFTLSDSVFGSVFYATTSLHAFHVLVGVLFLTVALVRVYFDSFTTEHALGLDFAIWYWHLVDVIWLLVFLVFYYWGGDIDLLISPFARLGAIATFSTAGGPTLTDSTGTSIPVLAKVDDPKYLKKEYGVAGVYAIQDNTSGEIYVGSSANIYQRLVTHASLSSNKQRIQRTINARPSDFSYYVILVHSGANSQELLTLERHYYYILACELNDAEPGFLQSIPNKYKITIFLRGRVVFGVYNSLTECAEALDVSVSTVKAKLHSGQPVKHNFWVTLDPDSFDYLPPRLSAGTGFPVNIISKEGKLVKRFVSATAAASWLGLTPHTVLSYIKTGVFYLDLVQFKLDIDFNSSYPLVLSDSEVSFLHSKLLSLKAERPAFTAESHKMGIDAAAKVNSKSVQAFSKEGELLGTFESMSAAAAHYGISKQTVSTYVKNGAFLRKSIGFRQVQD